MVRSIGDLRAAAAGWRAAGETFALVPTMGAVHDGHLALIRAARDEFDRVAATIFVNPKQFNDPADLASYPMEIDRDTALLAGAGADLLYLPAGEVMYPPGFATTVAVAGLTACLCGGRKIYTNDNAAFYVYASVAQMRSSFLNSPNLCRSDVPEQP